MPKPNRAVCTPFRAEPGRERIPPKTALDRLAVARTGAQLARGYALVSAGSTA